MIVRIIAQVLLLCVSAFFSGSETALFSLSRVDLRQFRRQRDPQAETIHHLLDHPRRLIISILCGNELVNIAAAANLTVILAALYGVEEAAWVTICVMVPLILLVGEVTPKTISVSNPSYVSSRIVAAPLGIWVTIVTPLYRAVRIVSDRFTTWIVGAARRPDNILQLDELRSLVERGVLEGELSATERTLIFNLLRAGSTEVVEIMTARTATQFIDADQTMSEIVEQCIEARRSHMPVFKDNRDNVMGFVYAEDIVGHLLDGDDLATLTLSDVMRPPVAVPVTKNVAELLDFFDETDARAALLIGEFGNTVGMVTLDNVLEFVFGQAYRPIPGTDKFWREAKELHVFPGEMGLIEFNAITNLGLSDPRMTTLAGFLIRHLGKIPVEGDTVAIEGLEFSVVRVHGNRIDQVGLSGLALPKGSEEEGLSEAPQAGT
ncbi:MAG: hemolysin family protein [Alphaproteobacteria bacterium]|nr:hemolysin family protein [Alphaproteobacteria bacterium]